MFHIEQANIQNGPDRGFPPVVPVEFRRIPFQIGSQTPFRNQRFFFQFDYFGIQFQDIVFHVGQQGIVIQIVAEKERFTDPEVIDSGWHDLVGQQRNRDRRASGNIGDGFSEFCVQQVAVKAKLVQLVVIRQDAGKAGQVRPHAHNVDMGKCQCFFIDGQNIIPQYAFPQFAQFDHDDDLVNLALPGRFGRQFFQCRVFRIEADIGVSDDIGNRSESRWPDAHGFDIWRYFFDGFDIGHAGIANPGHAQFSKLFQKKRMAAQEFGDDTPADTVPVKQAVQVIVIVFEFVSVQCDIGHQQSLLSSRISRYLLPNPRLRYR